MQTFFKHVDEMNLLQKYFFHLKKIKADPKKKHIIMGVEDARVGGMLKIVRKAAEVRLQRHISQNKEKSVERFVEEILKEKNLVHHEDPIGEIITFYSGLDFVHLSGNLAKYHVEKLVTLIKIILHQDHGSAYLRDFHKIKHPDPLIANFNKVLLSLNDRKDSLMVLVVKQINVMNITFSF